MISRIFIFIACLSIVNCSMAQESMMGEVSYPFLEKLIATAHQNYPKVKANERKLKIAKMNIDKEKLSWFNALNFTYLYSPTNSLTLVNPTYSTGFQLGIFFNVGTILSTGPSVKVAKEEYAIAQLDIDEYMLNLDAIVQERYFTYIQQVTLMNWRTKDMQNTESSLKDLKYKFENGEETFENYNKAREAYSTIVQAKITAESAMLVAKSKLEEIIGAKLETIK